MKVKGWQIAVIVLGLLVGGWLIGSQIFRHDPTKLNNEFYLFDPQTGNIYHADWRKVRFSVPAPDPESGDARLVRIFKDNGNWRVVDRDLPILDRLPEEKTAMVNVEDGTLKGEPKRSVEYRPPANP